jgi:hypothetical protein
MTRSSTVCFLPVLHHSFSVLPFSKLSRISNLVRRTCRPCVQNAVKIVQVVDFSCFGRCLRHALFTVISPNSLRFHCGVLRQNDARCGPGLPQKHASLDARCACWSQILPLHMARLVTVTGPFRRVRETRRERNERCPTPPNRIQ